jgi:hypothetical protein
LPRRQCEQWSLLSSLNCVDAKMLTTADIYSPLTSLLRL